QPAKACAAFAYEFNNLGAQRGRDLPAHAGRRLVVRYAAVSCAWFSGFDAGHSVHGWNGRCAAALQPALFLVDSKSSSSHLVLRRADDSSGVVVADQSGDNTRGGRTFALYPFVQRCIGTANDV